MHLHDVLVFRSTPLLSFNKSTVASLFYRWLQETNAAAKMAENKLHENIRKLQVSSRSYLFLFLI